MADELDSFLDSFTSPANQDVTILTPPDPEAARKYEQSRIVSGPNINPTGDQRFIQENRVEGIPLDVSEGLPFTQRIGLSLRPTEEAKAQYLINKYGPGNVRMSDDGRDFIIRMADDLGKQRDILANERGLSFGDVASVGTVIPEVVGAISGIRAGRATPGLQRLPGTIRDIAAGAVGSETAGTLKDIFFSEGTPIKEIASERASNIPVNMAFDLATLGMAKTLGALGNRVLNPFRGAQTQTQTEALQSARNIEKSTGIKLPLSAGEATGRPFLSMIESYVESQPAGTSAQKEFRNRQDSQIRKLQDILFLNAPSDVEVGEKAVKFLQDARTGVDVEVRTNAKGLRETTTKEIQDIISKSTVPQAQLYKEETGNTIRSAIVNLRDQAKAESDRLYGLVRQAEGGTGKVFEGAELAVDASDILKNLPSPLKTKKVATGLLDAQGRPMTISKQEQELMKSFLPERILNRVNELISNRDAKYSLSDLQQMRRDIYDDITKSEAVPDTGVHYLNEIGKALTKSIEEGVNKLPSGELKTALKNANEYYKKEVVKFSEAGIGDLFREVSDPGFKEGQDIIARLSTDPSKYTRTLNIIGKDSDAAKILRRSIADDIFQKSLSDSTGKTLDSQAFFRNMINLKNNNRTIFDDVFGKKFTDLEQLAAMGSYAQGKMDVTELRDYVSGPPQKLNKNLLKLIRSQAKQQTIYENEIIKKFTKGELETKAIDPSEFINKYIDKAKPDDLAKVMSLMSGDKELVENLRRKAIEKIFITAERTPTALDITRKASGDPSVMASGKSLFKALGDKENQEKLRMVLGNERFSLLNDYIKWEAARDFKKEVAENVGIFAKGSAIGSLLHSIPGFATLTNFAKTKVLSNMLASDWFTAWASNEMTLPQVKDLTMKMVASGPFIRGVIEDFAGDETMAHDFLSKLKGALNPQEERQQQQRAQPEQAQDIDSFLDSLTPQ